MTSSAVKDIYWGEFPESELDIVLRHMRAGDMNSARAYIEEKTKRTDFIFGSARSDFLYYTSHEPETHCLDIGCGLGVHTFNMARYAHSVTAFDLSAKRAEFCNLRAQLTGVTNISCTHDSLKTFDPKGKTFNTIIMNGILEWVPEDRVHKDPRMDQLDALRKVKSLMSKDGMLYVGIENRFALNYLTSARDHNHLRYTSFMPRFLASLITKILCGKPYRTYTYSAWGYKKLFRDAGFSPAHTELYIAHPGYNLPKYLIPFEDISALRFFIDGLMEGKGVRGSIIRFLARSNIFLRMIRHGFYSYAIFAKNSHD